MRTKIISVMTALLLCVGMFSTTAFAYVEGDANAEDTAEAEVTTDTAETDEETAEGDAEPTLEVTVSEDGTTTYTYGDWSWTVDSEDETEDEEETTTLTGTVVDITSYLNLRSGAGMDYSVIGKLTNGTEVEVIGEENGWYQVTADGQTGYVYSDYLEVTEATAEETEDSELDSMDETLMMMMFSLLVQNSTDTDDTSLALTPDGNLSLIDDIDTATDEDTGKQFITVVTKSGNYFYIIIDRDDEGEETVHFLNQVDEADLLALMDEEDVEEYEASVSGTDTDTEDSTDETDSSAVTGEDADMSETEDTEVTEDDTESGGVNALPAVVIVVILAAVGGFFAYTKMKGKKKEETKPDPDADYTDEDDGEDYELPDTYDDSDYSDEDDSTFEDDEPV